MQTVQKTRYKLKHLAVQYKGGKCSLCGYNKCFAALDFHHVDPSNKDFVISQHMKFKNWDKIQKELDKCILLCANCHRELHYSAESKNIVLTEVELLETEK